jgi:hypothetical protein
MIYLFSDPSKPQERKCLGINPPTLLAYADLIIE